MLLILAESYADVGNFNGATNSTAALIKRLRDARFGTAQALPNYAKSCSIRRYFKMKDVWNLHLKDIATKI
jgi:hypothetical protein